MKSYDPKCYELASYFLANETRNEQRVQELAGVIQQSIEDYLDADHPPLMSPPWTNK